MVSVIALKFTWVAMEFGKRNKEMVGMELRFLFMA